MDRIRALELFVAVAEAGSFAAGGRQLGLSPPSVTRGINDLENRLGVRLFTRTTRVITLTEIGATYLDEVRGILADLAAADDLVSGVATRPTGTLRITAPVEFGARHIAPILAEYLDLYPEVSAQLLTVDRIVNLVEEGLDVGIRIGPLADSGLMAIRVGEVRRVFCASPGYLATFGTPRRPQDLQQHRIIAISGGALPADWRFGRDMQEQLRLRPRLTVSNVAAGLSLARSGWGLTRVLSYQIAPELHSGALETVLEDYEPPPLPIHLVHQQGRRVTAKLRCFLDLASKRLRPYRAFGF